MNSVDLSVLLRKKCLKLSWMKKTSHLGSSLSIVDILSVLYTDVLSFQSENPYFEERDRLFYSKGHACTALYAVLEEKGFFSNLEDKFALDGEYFTSHINHNIPGVEFSTGSLGHALPVSVGVALAAKKRLARWKVYCIISDGELDEGSNWESILLAPHLKLDNLILIIDYNKIQSFGFTNDVINLESLSEKFKAFNWNTFEIDGHNHEDIKKFFYTNRNLVGPTVVIAHTIKGKGISFMENKLEWHYKSPSLAEYNSALEELNI